MVKRYEELTISDDFMFGKTMGDKVLCQDVLEQLLEEQVGELEDVQPQREFRYTSGGKPIRLDIYTRDKKRMYDAEMQNQNHQPVEKLELPKRSRFYQSTMDTDHLSKGKSYRELPEGRDSSKAIIMSAPIVRSVSMTLSGVKRCFEPSMCDRKWHPSSFSLRHAASEKT